MFETTSDKDMDNLYNFHFVYVQLYNTKMREVHSLALKIFALHGVAYNSLKNSHM